MDKLTCDINYAKDEVLQRQLEIAEAEVANRCADLESANASLTRLQGRKLLSYSHCQELDQLADLTSDWFFNLVWPIRSQLACSHNS